ncbi:hypothetical protein DPMN_153410 [Dreissena polymorpha]|uniref:Laminin/attractin/netrin-like EGF domain-containing protein n=1 Tax=Dreissena polymorpha TaxID=45954 RepID=A0A9D4FIL2_DREPO|nr:hypothetical protein DPMN_153410 [Dreissena polymorpha]
MYSIFVIPVSGLQCQECKPLYVGDPKDGGHCTSCTEFCNEHSDVCIRFNHYAKSAQIMGLLERFKDVKSPGFMSEVD